MQRGRVTAPGLLLSLCIAAGLIYLRLHGGGAQQRDAGEASSAGNTGNAGGAASAYAIPYDYFLLSLSWSPSYCLTHDDDRAQCSRGYGFVLHGLWPQDMDGGYPQHCASDAPLTAAAEARGAALFPSPRLMQHEWRQHGTCSGLGALDYFDAADRALAAVKIPAAFEAPRANQSMDVRDIIAAFRAANPAMPDGGLVVACNRDELAEVRVCLSRTLEPIACGRGLRNSCPDVALRIPAAR
ncbi:MAG: ribonuclease T2 [Proteobacteria bacterium]|nr:ribonuclease T2 [Pseudomonadota bacterium]